MTVDISGCGAPEQSAAIPASVDLEKETVITGLVTVGAEPVGGAYVRPTPQQLRRQSNRHIRRWRRDWRGRGQLLE